MPWDYLSTKPLDVRFLCVAGYLEHRGLVTGKRLVDLNCGTARLLRYIPSTFDSYIANDLHQRPDSSPQGLSFVSVSDSEMPSRLAGNIDALLVFGFADSRFCNSSWESDTISDTITHLIRRHRPPALIIDVSVEYEKNFGVLSALLSKIDSYVIDHDIKIATTGQSGHAERRIVMLCPQASPYNVHRQPDESIHLYYLRRAIECVSEFRNPRVLKTDACNESHDYLPCSGGIALNLPSCAEVTVVEWDVAVIEAAKLRHPMLQLRHGDIRSLQDFTPGTFDVVLDLSTLDHIQPKDVHRALSSYQRVLKENGTLLLVFWASLNRDLITVGDCGEWNHGKQYYFEIDTIRETLKSLGFVLLTEDHVCVTGSEILDCLKCKLSNKT